MNIHEYQAKNLLQRYGVMIQPGGVAYSAAEAKDVASSLGGNLWVVKAQIHAGGRGKAGGVKLAKSLEEVTALSQEIIGKTLVTPQTGPQGKKVRRLYIEKGCAIEKELYISLVLDREKRCLVFIASTEGGMDIEEVAAHQPDWVFSMAIDPAVGIQSFHGREIAARLGLKGLLIPQMVKIISGMGEAFQALDANMIEINPLVITKDGQLIVLDTKMSFDDNAMYRHEDLKGLHDPEEEDPIELEAHRLDLSYVKLDGNIGCMVNGAGLAMATMDIIKLCGGNPANFLDVGGGADREKVTAAFKIILSDPNVEGVLVNIFGGIMRCDLIAEGIIAAAREINLNVPLVVRLQGTNMDLGRQILAQSGLAIHAVEGLAEAAEKIVKVVKENI